jgi:hypothetical protein
LHDQGLRLLEVLSGLGDGQTVVGRFTAKRELARAALHRVAQQRGLEVPVAEHGGGLAQHLAVDQREAGPERLRIDPLEALVAHMVGQCEERGAAGRGDAGDMRVIGNEPVGKEQQASRRVDRGGRFIDGSRHHRADAFGRMRSIAARRSGGSRSTRMTIGSAPAAAASRACRSSKVRPASGSVARKAPSGASAV